MKEITNAIIELLVYLRNNKILTNEETREITKKLLAGVKNGEAKKAGRV